VTSVADCCELTVVALLFVIVAVVVVNFADVLLHEVVTAIPETS